MGVEHSFHYIGENERERERGTERDRERQWEKRECE